MYVTQKHAIYEKSRVLRKTYGVSPTNPAWLLHKKANYFTVRYLRYSKSQEGKLCYVHTPDKMTHTAPKIAPENSGDALSI